MDSNFEPKISGSRFFAHRQICKCLFTREWACQNTQYINYHRDGQMRQKEGHGDKQTWNQWDWKHGRERQQRGWIMSCMEILMLERMALESGTETWVWVSVWYFVDVYYYPSENHSAEGLHVTNSRNHYYMAKYRMFQILKSIALIWPAFPISPLYHLSSLSF